MKKAYFQNILSIIKKNKVSYVAIMMFVFFSVHMYLLITYLSEDLYKSVDNSYDFYRKYDVAVYVGSEIDEDICEKLSRTKGTSEVETAHISYGYIETDVGKLDTEVRTITEKFALPIDLEGRLPKKSNEIAFIKSLANSHNIKIGDTITLENDSYVQGTKFVVTALFESAQFSRKPQSAYGCSRITNNVNSCVVFVNKVALNSNYVNDNYIMLKNNLLNGISKFSDEYRILCEDYIEKISDELDSLVGDDYYIERWNEEEAYSLIEIYIYIIKNIRKTLVSVLFFVAIVVLIITILRMIVNQKNEIGIMKATGFTNNEIANIFYIYSISATVIGNILANIFVFFSEKFVVTFISDHLALKKDSFVFDIKEVAFIFLITILIMFFTTHVCIKNILDKEVTDILSKRKTTSIKIFFYEYLSLFKKLPIFVQIIINNMLKDGKRCIEIIIAIIGSATLLVCGVMINRNVYNGYEYQMKNDICFDTLLFCTPLESTRDEIEKILKKNRIDYALCQYTCLVLKTKKNTVVPFTLYIYDDKESFSKFFKFNTMDKKNHNYEGLFLQESYKKYYDLDEHGYIKVKNLKGKFVYKRVSQYFYNYIESTLLSVIDKKTYEDMMDTESYMQTFLINRKKGMESVYDELSDVDGYLYHADLKKAFEEGFTAIYSSINAIVGIFIITSILFNFSIVINLMKVNIMERKREIITLMINGFSRNEINKYFIIDMILMYIFGTVIGVILGIKVASFVLDSFSSEKTLFLNMINYGVIFISLTLNFAISFIIAKLSVKEIDKMDISNMEDL